MLPNTIPFNRSWNGYKAGFGNAHDGEYYLGNGYIHALAPIGKPHDLIIMVYQNYPAGQHIRAYYGYQNFSLASESEAYKTSHFTCKL